jgi:alanine-synthesizing transaminase
MVECPKASMYVWAKIPEPYAAMGSLEFAKKLLNEAKVCVSPGIGFGDYGDTHVRFALIETGTVRARRSAASRRCSAPMACCPPRASASANTP